MKIFEKEMMWAGRRLTLETGRLARQATGAVLATYGETSVLCTVVALPEAKADMDFLPLSVHYQEKTYAAGKIPGGFLKREGKPSERETLTSRLIDRPIRPLFPDGFFNEVQVICTVLSFDHENDPDLVALIGASAALSISGIPFAGPVGCARVGYQNNSYVLNPFASQLNESEMDLMVAGTRDGVLMVESEIGELSEDVVLKGVVFGHEAFQPVLEMIDALVQDVQPQRWEIEPHPHLELLRKEVALAASKDLDRLYKEPHKARRHEGLRKLKKNVLDALAESNFSKIQIEHAFKALSESIMRQRVLEKGIRIDGRDVRTIRPIRSEVGVLPRVHGSGLFTRGDTQALVITTLGTSGDAQLIDALDGEYKESFMLNYNFPPFSVGEVGRMMGPGRREIGHGKLAWRALHPLLPSQEAFPYILRIVSEITESDGSSSMATVCGASLSLMDAGVPLLRPVAGIAMGLIKEGDDFAILSDILGDEDSLGDMDFKVAGTEKGITALQMDIKITSITPAIMAQALEQARDGRLHILSQMAHALDVSREKLNAHAPRIEILKIPKEKIRDVIGPGGKVIREICETTGAKIDIEDDGTVRIFSSDEKNLEAALQAIRAVTFEPSVGEIYQGTVVKLMEFGAFVNFMGQDGLVHISEIASQRIDKVSDVLKVGDAVTVKVVGFDPRGKIKLSMKQVALQTPPAA
jgi:polyribonucleotide nucleotidyltransferase